MEATGVYCDRLCYFLASREFALVVEAPHKVKMAFSKLTKSDSVDSRQIAENAYRFKDELKLWKPKEEIVENIKVLMTTREQLTIQKTGLNNSLKAMQRKHIPTFFAEETLSKSIKHLKKQIIDIEKEVEKLIKNDKDFYLKMSLLVSIPSVGKLLLYNLFAHTDGFVEDVNYKQLASYLGIAPLEYSIGSSVYRKPRSKQRGPSRLRKLIYLAALSLSYHNKQFKKYYLRKVAEGKSKRLVLNNISNKLLKIICAVIKNKQFYIENYMSIHPKLLN